jgi:hypothetical protein
MTPPTISAVMEKNDAIPPPPQLQGKKSRSPSVDNGIGDYDVPRSSKGNGDYDVPISQKERELRERAGQLGAAVPGPRMNDVSPRSSHRGSSGGEDYDVPLLKEERMRREKVTSMLAARSRRMSDTSSEGSRPLSCASSIYSADASSVSLPSSHSGSKLAIPSGGDENSFVSQSSIDQQLEMIDQLVEDVAAQNLAKVHTLSTSRAHRSSSRGNLDEEGGSSNSGSNDNLGVWDDISSDSDSDEAEGEFKGERRGRKCRGRGREGWGKREEGKGGRKREGRFKKGREESLGKGGGKG